MFLGSYVFNLDSKARLTIPAKYREILAPTLVVTRHPVDNCLLVLPMPEFQRLRQRVSALPMADPDSAHLRRVIFSAAEDLRADNQGRILISKDLRDYALINDTVKVVGQDAYLELWSPEAWAKKVESRFDDAELNGRVFAALGI
jgi:MraZ protein